MIVHQNFKQIICALLLFAIYLNLRCVYCFVANAKFFAQDEILFYFTFLYFRTQLYLKFINRDIDQ